MILATPESIKHYTDQGIWGQKTLIDAFKTRVQASPDQECIVDPPNRKALNGFDPERLTYREFDRAVDATAEALANLGIGRDDIVMVQIPNSWELAMLYLAISRTGAIITPAPVLWRSAELGHIAGLTRAKALITLEVFNGFKHLEMARQLQQNYPSLTHIISLAEIREMSRGEVSGKLDGVRIDPNDIFTICWTSGTEAQPKGCPLSHNNWFSMAMLQESAGIQPNDIFLTAGPLVNMASVGTVYIPWIVMGGKLVLHHPFDPQIFIQQIMQEKVNYTLMVPAITNAIAKHPMVDQFDLSSFRAITVGSAPPSLWTMQEFKRRWGIDIGNIWGQNEGTGIVSGLADVPDITKRADHFPQFGKPGSKWKSRAARFVQVKIVDGEGRELTQVGDVGELTYKGPGMIAGYYKNPEANRKSFTEDGFFRTGDIFQIKEDNCISFYERGKDIVIRGGFNISSQEIENYLLGHPKVQEVAIVSMPDEILGEKMCVYAVPMEGETLTLADLTGYLAEKGVAKYKYPERVEIIGIIPRNPVGKILKNQLRDDIRHKLAKQ
ncbi:MAG: class I adenylate-forming enzyme family protein [bacterium]